MKINYEKLAEILEPYGLYVEDNVVKGETQDKYDIEFLALKSLFIRSVARDIKDNKISDKWPASIKLLIPILHPHYNEIFQPSINKEKLIEVFKKYAGWEVENNYLLIPYNENNKKYTKYCIDVLIKIYEDNLNNCGYNTSAYTDIFLSFMRNYEDEFMD